MQSYNFQLTTLQGVRGISAVMVVLFHAIGMVPTAPPIFRYVFGWGYCGVDFFFVLSGFILLYRHYEEIGRPEKIGGYLGKRFTRIFPAYWSVLALLIPACFLVRGLVSPEKKALGYIVASVFLLPQWDPFLGVAWSLSCEIFFYLIFALLIFSRKGFFVAAFLWLALIVANLQTPLPFPLDFLCQARVMEFLGGMSIAWIIRRGGRLSRRGSISLIFSGVCICLTTGTLQIAYGFSGIVYPLWFGLAATLIIASLISLELSGLASMGKTWLLLGDASYAIYLVHYPALLVVFKVLKNRLASPVIWLLAVILSIIAGTAFHLVVEKRVCDRARLLIIKKPKVQSSPVPA